MVAGITVRRLASRIASSLFACLIVTSWLCAPQAASAAWSPWERIYADGAGVSQTNRAVAADENGRVHAVWHGGGVLYSRREPSGWTTPEILTTTGNDAAIAVEPSGAAHVVWDAGGEVYYKRWGGSSWSPDVRLTFGPGNSQGPAVAVGPDGNVHVVWYADRQTHYHFQVYYRRWDGSSWTPEEQISNSTVMGLYSSVATGPDGSAHVVWIDVTTGYRSYVYHRMWNGTSWTESENIGTGVYADPSNATVAVDTLGRIHVAWSTGNEDAETFFYRQWDGTSWIPMEQISTDDAGIGLPSLTVGPYGDAHIATCQYDDPYDQKVWYQRRDGTGWTAREIVSSPETDPVMYPSIEADARGRLHLSWFFARIETYGINYRFNADGQVDVDGDAPFASHPDEITCAPNPFTASTSLRIDSGGGRDVTVRIFDAAGRATRALRGAAPLLWDGRDDQGRPVAPGVYLVRSETGGAYCSGRIVRIR